MKQHITTGQLDELSENSWRKLVDWSAEKELQPTTELGKRIEPLLSIGQMIEFLVEHINKLEDDNFQTGHSLIRNYDWFSADKPRELCDALWLAVKGVLNEK